MRIDRRKFLKSLGNVAAIQLLPSSSFAYFQHEITSASSGKPRIAVFSDPSFPPLGEIALTPGDLQTALEEFSATFLTLEELLAGLKIHNYELFINPYGSAFPKEAFGVLHEFLLQGGNWLNIGGVPLSLPVARDGHTWKVESPQVAYHKKLDITQSFPVIGSSISSFKAANGFEQLNTLSGEFEATEIYELYCRFTSSKDFPSEDGSAGPRDAILQPLILGYNHQNINIAAPVIMVDRMVGACSGGKWVFANFKGKLTTKGITLLARQAVQSVLELNVRPSFACYYEGENPAFTVRLKQTKILSDDHTVKDAYLTIWDDHDKLIERIPFRVNGNRELDFIRIDLPDHHNVLKSGLYHVRAVVTIKSQNRDEHITVQSENGFWMYDEEMMSRQKPLSVDRNYFYRDGKPYPVTGTTYMTSDVHRKFLFEPNPHLWNEDFQAMKETGINMVRTGFWTGWKNAMFDAGSPNEGVLRAMDAFVLTAQKYEMPVILTLFAFLPESWGGENAYLDPRSVSAQKEFIAAIAQRYKNVNCLIWDLINEPSFCNPQHLWQCRPNYDRFEQAAWKEWLDNKYLHAPVQGEKRSEEETFRITSGEEVRLPALEDFDDVNVFERRQPITTIDYHLFAQDKFSEWVATMSGIIRNNGNVSQLITVGQDEGGTTESPNNHFLGDHIDFTSVHNWWLNDDLVWDNVMTGTFGKANLVEETGLMFYEKMDGSPLRTEDNARNLLERKLAISIGAGGAGFIEWIWNTNPYMMSDNEAAIGLHRVDGTAKPECEAVTRFSEYFHENKHRMTGKIEDEVVLVIPHSQIYSPRSLSSDATKRCVRVLTYDFNLQIRSVSEYRINIIRNPPVLLVCPSPQTLSQNTWIGLLNLVEKGSVLYISGPLDLDDHWFTTDRLKEFGLQSITQPVAEEEYITIDEKEFRLSFRGDKMQRVLKAVPQPVGKERAITIPHGKGKIVWVSVPIELSDSTNVTGALYSSLIRDLPVHRFVTTDNRTSSVLMLPTVFDETIMCIFVSESDRDETIKFVHHESQYSSSVRIKGQRTEILFLDRRSGHIISQMGS
jgi:hypothetical protein